MSNNKQDQSKESVSDLKAKFNVAGDYNLALALQEQEFDQHYNTNRSARRISLEDHKVSGEEQAKERHNALSIHLAEMNKIMHDDELMALELQKQFEEEERQHREIIVNSDAELAQRLAAEFNSYQLPSTSGNENEQQIENNSMRSVDDDLEALFGLNVTNDYSQSSNNSTLTPQLTNWSLTNPFLQDLIDLGAGPSSSNEHGRTLTETISREHSADK